MSGVRDGSSVRVAMRTRRADAGVVSEMARSLHREARSERERGVERGRAREIVCAIEATHRMRSPRVLITRRPRRAAAIA
jgi:hypothetical protein